MDVRFKAVQEELQKHWSSNRSDGPPARPVSFEFHPDDEREHEEHAPGQLVRPRYQPQDI
eukprot:8103669-Pyramimonas_sp.AAC.1